jgi:hypothetical protein
MIGTAKNVNIEIFMPGGMVLLHRYAAAHRNRPFFIGKK